MSRTSTYDPTTDTKECRACDRRLPATAFNKSKLTLHGLDGYCRECVKKRYDDDKEARRLYARARNIKHRHGLTVDEYDELVKNGCTICGRQGGRIVIDHNHKNGKIRAALCNQCNVAIGQVEDNPKTLRKLADYLEHHGDFAH